jgi:hypothetical protein
VTGSALPTSPPPRPGGPSPWPATAPPPPWRSPSGSACGTAPWRTDPVRVILVREIGTKTRTTTGYDLALVTTDLTTTPQEIIARYAAHWSIEVTFFDVKNILGVGQARNRVTQAVERTVPFGLFCHSLLILWYTRHGHPTTDTAHRRASAPWYSSKTEPSTLDMLTALRHQIIAARFLPSPHRPATTQEILEVQQAWTLAAA